VAKTRAQRKAERRKREAREARQTAQERTDESRAQHDTQVPESADVIEAELAEQGADLDALTRARGDTAVAEPEEAVEPEVAVEPAEVAVEPEEVAESTTELEAPAPSRADVGRADEGEPADKLSRRAQRKAERDRRQRAKESEVRRRPREEPAERQRGPIISFLISCWAELKRVQWPDRETLIQASAVTILFIAVAAAYLGALDAVFNQLVKLIL
jgi:preprotein translocase SecE subunit